MSLTCLLLSLLFTTGITKASLASVNALTAMNADLILFAGDLSYADGMYVLIFLTHEYLCMNLI